ncbi:MAG: HAD family hydrolase [Planctomycetota bacterium]|jgi:phosphoserine phosphatase
MESTRKFDLILFDMDGTLTEVHSPWQFIHERLGLWENLGDRHLQAWLAGEIDYLEFFRRDVEMWLGKPKEVLLGILDEIPLKPGVSEALTALHAAGVHLTILSTGFDHVSRRIQEVCGFPIPTWANVMRFDDAGRLEAVDMNASGDEASPISKRVLAGEIMKRFGTTRERTLAVGDSQGDTGMFEAAGFSLAVHGSPDIGARGRLSRADLQSCLEWVFEER